MVPGADLHPRGVILLGLGGMFVWHNSRFDCNRYAINRRNPYADARPDTY